MAPAKRKAVQITVTIDAEFENAIEHVAFLQSVEGALGVITKTYSAPYRQNAFKSVKAVSA